MSLLDQIREFRERHWRFTKQYIIEFSKHPVATGGSPIITWLPNQLTAVLNEAFDVSKKVDTTGFNQDQLDLYKLLRSRADEERKLLNEEVQEL